MRTVSILSACITFALACMLFQAARAAPTIALVDTEVVITPDKETALGSLVLTIIPETAAAGAKPRIKAIHDVKKAAAAPPTVTFSQDPVEVAGVGPAVRFLLPFTVAQMPAAARLTRYVELQIDGVTWTGSYRLATGPAPPAPVPVPWRILAQSMSKHVAGADWAVPIDIIIPKNANVSGFKLGTDTLMRAPDFRRLAGGKLAICPTEKPCAGDGMDLPSPSRRVWLTRLAPGEEDIFSDPGTYTGSVMLVSNDRPEGETVSVTVAVTNPWVSGTGVALIGIGVGLSYLFSTFLRHWIRRYELLMPAVELRATIDSLRGRIAGLSEFPSMPNVSQRMNDLDMALSDNELVRKGLPAPNPSFVQILAGDTSGLTTHVEEQRLLLNAIWIIVDEGLESLAELRDELKPPTTPQDFSTAFQKQWDTLDRLATHTSALSHDTLRASIAASLQAYRVAVMPDPAGQLAPAHAMMQRLAALRRSVRTPSIRDPIALRYRIERYQEWGWIFVIFLTVFTGFYLLIFKNTGFGTMGDLIDCFLWGLGLPAGAMSAASAITSINATYRPAR